MLLEQIYYLAGIITGVGVILSLIFVGVQIREQVRESRLAANCQASREVREMLEQGIADPSRGELMFRSINGIEDLNRNEIIRLFAVYGGLMRTFEALFYQNRDGRMDDWMWRSVQQPFGGFVSNAGFEAYWGVNKNAYTTDFQNYIENIMREGPSPFFKMLYDFYHSQT